VLGFSRLTWARFVLHQDMQTVLRCHMAAFEAIGGVPNEILSDRMKTTVIGEAGGSVVYNRALLDCRSLPGGAMLNHVTKEKACPAGNNAKEWWINNIVDDPPPLKWSDLRYVFDIQEDCNGKEAIQA
jgi:hypothetical protein